jgi:uncharacterized spore protein YtfJ
MARFSSESPDDAVAEALTDPANADAAKAATDAATEDLTTRLAERFGKAARADAVFGAPVEREGVTVIPVARARYGFGAGSGDEGSGGGGGMMVAPVGWIELSNGGSRFKPLRSRSRPAIAIALLLIISGIVAGAINSRPQPKRRPWR